VIVIEASAMASALVDSPTPERLLQILESESLHSPALLDFEVASVLGGHVLGGKLTTRRMTEAASDFAAFEIERYEMTGDLGAILDLRDNFTAYDAAYVVLALALQAPLVTRDAKLVEARRLGVTVELL